MTPEQAQNYILEQITLMAEHKYPNSKDLQNQFKIGFLAGNLASAFRHDNWTYYRFKQRVQELGYKYPRSNTLNKQQSN